MFHRNLKTATTCFTFALLAGLGSANAMPLTTLDGATALTVKVAQYGTAANRAYGDPVQRRAYGYDARGRSYGAQDDEIHALQYVYPQTYGWPRGTENQF
jgi:hypothetical protein